MTLQDRFQRLEALKAEHAALAGLDTVGLAMRWHDVAAGTWAHQAERWIRTRLLQAGLPETALAGPLEPRI